MVVPPKHPKMIIFSRKTHGCWGNPPFSETHIYSHELPSNSQSLQGSNSLGGSLCRGCFIRRVFRPRSERVPQHPHDHWSVGPVAGSAWSKQNFIYYCWWKKSCTSWYGKCPVIYRVSYMLGGAGFLPSTVTHDIYMYATMESALARYLYHWVKRVNQLSEVTTTGTKLGGGNSNILYVHPYLGK